MADFYRKAIIIIVVAMFVERPHANGQDVNHIPVLSCMTWGKPDWSKLDSYLAKRGIYRTGARLRGENDFIDPLLPNVGFRTLSNEVYFRWLTADTTIFYDIAITDDRQVVVFKTTSNQCGLRLPVNSLSNGSEFLVVAIKTNRYYSKGSGVDVSFYIRPLSGDFRDSIEMEIRGFVQPLNMADSSAVNFFLDKSLPLEVLSALESELEQDPGDHELITRYWDIVNDIHIREYEKNFRNHERLKNTHPEPVIRFDLRRKRKAKQ